jgi:hypothetical protein
MKSLPRALTKVPLMIGKKHLGESPSMPQSNARSRISPIDPQDVMLEVLRHLSSDHRRLTDFLDVTGLRPEALRAGAADGTLRPALMHFLLERESLLLEIAASLCRGPDEDAAVASKV